MLVLSPAGSHIRCTDMVDYITVLIQVCKNAECGRTKARLQYILLEIAAPHQIAIDLFGHLPIHLMLLASSLTCLHFI